jgi:hypothetical protein
MGPTMTPSMVPTTSPTEDPKKKDKITAGQIILWVILGIIAIALIYVGGSFLLGIGDDKKLSQHSFRAYKFRYGRI